MRPDLVIFDCDGVLVDSERLTIEVEARMLTELGWAVTPEEVVARFVGVSSATMLAVVRDHLGSDLTDRFDRESTAEIHRAFDESLEAVEGIVDLLDHLEANGVPTCVASSGSHAKMRRTLGRTLLYDRFEGRIHSADEVAEGKPAPDLFLHAARSMATPPERCAVVEDSPHGVRAALAAGMTAYGYAGGLTSAATLADVGAHVVVDRMTDLARWLTPDAADLDLSGG